MYLGSTEIAKAYLGSNLVYSSGSGPSPSPSPVFYDLLVFDGTAYILTDYVLPSDSSIKLLVGWETTKARQGIFQAYDANNGGSILAMLGNNTSSSRRQMVCYYDSTSYLLATQYLNFITTSYNLFLTPNKFGWDNYSYSISKGSAHPTDGLRIGKDATRCFTGKMGTIYIYDSSAQNCSTASGFNSFTPIATFRPCTYNGAAGMWYVEGNTFFGNSAGSGTLSTENL